MSSFFVHLACLLQRKIVFIVAVAMKTCQLISLHHLSSVVMALLLVRNAALTCYALSGTMEMIFVVLHVMMIISVQQMRYSSQLRLNLMIKTSLCAVDAMNSVPSILFS